jgi:hypothetical protein
MTVTVTVGGAPHAGDVVTFSPHGGPLCGGDLEVIEHTTDRNGMDHYVCECQQCHRRSERWRASGTCTDMHPDHKPAYTVTIAPGPSR